MSQEPAANHKARPTLALHWRILIALVLGTVVGLLINIFWTKDTWAGIGVNDPRAFLNGVMPTDPAANADAGMVAHIARFR